MVRVGVIGLGMMGSTHLDVYAARKDVQVVALSDIDPQRLSGRVLAKGNIDGQTAGGFDIRGADVQRHDEGMKLIADADVDLVDICLPTPLHVEYALAALKKGRHLMVEKPVGRTYREAQRLVKAAAKARGFSMVGMCMRFWPGWTWLKDAVSDDTYGHVRGATFRRVSEHPGGAFYLDGERCGGALLDLHVHDADFIYHLFGVPQSVSTAGYTSVTGEIDHLVTRYDYGSDGPALVVAEGGWAMCDGFGFSMTYTVNFERATAVFDLAAPKPLMLYERGREPVAVPIQPGMGYDHELAYLLRCIRDGIRPTTVTVEDAAVSLKIAEAERKSAMTGLVVKVRG